MLEDLYIMSKEGSNWALCACKCETSECLEGDVQMFEPVYGQSLSNLFGNVVTFYFPFQRSTSCNAFTTFFFAESGYHKLYEVKNKLLKPLESARQACKEQFNSK